MSKLLFTVNLLFVILMSAHSAFAANLLEKTDNKTIVITSETLTADSKNNTATFEGSVVAKTDDVTMSSDKMTVFYDNSESKVMKIIASGNVKVNKAETALFSDKAVYLDKEGQIIFTGDPKAVEGENVITGTQIIFYIKDERAVVEGSRVILKNRQGLK